MILGTLHTVIPGTSVPWANGHAGAVRSIDKAHWPRALKVVVVSVGVQRFPCQLGFKAKRNFIPSSL